MDQSTSLERPYKELLNALIAFEIGHFLLKIWGARKGLKMVFGAYMYIQVRIFESL